MIKTVEQKAKAYDEAKYIMKEYLESGNAGVIAENTIKKAFPELSESEDERIKKELIEFLKSASGGFLDTTIQCKTFGKWVTWLEKQGNANKEYWRGYREDKQEILDKYAELGKQGEQKHDDSYCQENCKGFQETGKCFADGECKAKREAEQRNAWSEEDEKYIKDLTDYFTGGMSLKHTEEDIIAWIKSLKERVQPQLQQEWSEEDDYNLQCCIAKVQNDIDNGRIGRNRELLTWLKSLRPQSQWKPSEGQLECLGYAIEKAENDWSPLTNNGIYLTLKALKEQLLELSGSKV